MKIIILKAIGLLLLFIVTVIGCNAHFNGEAKTALKYFKDNGECDRLEKCPRNAIDLEKTFVGLTIICIGLSTCNLIAGFIVDLSKLRVADAAYYILAAGLLIVAATVIITAAIYLDVFFWNCYINPTDSCPLRQSKNWQDYNTASTPEKERKELRKYFKYIDKIVAGVLAFINAILYLITAVIIVTTNGRKPTTSAP